MALKFLYSLNTELLHEQPFYTLWVAEAVTRLASIVLFLANVLTLLSLEEAHFKLTAY
jgi:hypothetical protein